MGIVSKKVVLIRWDTLPCDIREWFKEYFGPLFGEKRMLPVKTELPVSCLGSIESMREQMVNSWRADEVDVSSDTAVLEYITDHGDAGAFIYRILQLFPKFELTDETEIIMDMCQYE